MHIQIHGFVSYTQLWVCISAGLDPRVPPNLGSGSVGTMTTYPIGSGSVSMDLEVIY